MPEFTGGAGTSVAEGAGVAAGVTVGEGTAGTSFGGGKYLTTLGMSVGEVGRASSNVPE